MFQESQRCSFRHLIIYYKQQRILIVLLQTLLWGNVIYFCNGYDLPDAYITTEADLGCM